MQVEYRHIQKNDKSKKEKGRPFCIGPAETVDKAKERLFWSLRNAMVVLDKSGQQEIRWKCTGVKRRTEHRKMVDVSKVSGGLKTK